jgi:hypothetical protein
VSDAVTPTVGGLALSPRPRVKEYGEVSWAAGVDDWLHGHMRMMLRQIRVARLTSVSSIDKTDQFFYTKFK